MIPVQHRVMSLHQTHKSTPLKKERQKHERNSENAQAGPTPFLLCSFLLLPPHLFYFEYGFSILPPSISYVAFSGESIERGR